MSETGAVCGMDKAAALAAMKERHSVRSYDDKPLPPDVLATLREAVDQVNAESGLHVQLVANEPEAFDGFMAHYGKFSGVRNYLAFVGKKSAGLDEACGYYGERLVLLAQHLGLNTCWVGMTFKKVKGAFDVASDEKLVIVVSLGYGTTQGVSHKVKPADAVSNVDASSPEWFKEGMEAALLAPTAVNQQKFFFERTGNTVKAKVSSNMAFFAKVDLGIAKCHFEIAAGKENFTWA